MALAADMTDKECTASNPSSPVLCVTITTSKTIGNGHGSTTTSVIYEVSTTELVTSSTLLQIMTVTATPATLNPDPVPRPSRAHDNHGPRGSKSHTRSTPVSTERQTYSNSPTPVHTDPRHPTRSSSPPHHSLSQSHAPASLQPTTSQQTSQSNTTDVVQSKRPRTSDKVTSSPTSTGQVPSKITFDHSPHTTSQSHSHTATSSSKSARTSQVETHTPGAVPLHSTDQPQESSTPQGSPSKIYIGVFSALGGLVALLILGCIIYSIHRRWRRKKKARDRRREDMPEISRPILPPSQYVPTGYYQRALPRAPAPAIPPRSFSRPRMIPPNAAPIRTVPKRRSNGSDWSYNASSRRQRGWSNPFDME